MPAPIAIERDPQGRIAQVVDRLGNRVTVAYDDASTPVAVPGDAGVTVSGLRDIAATPAGGEPAHASGGWAFTGVPAADASASGAPERFAGLPQRHARAREHVVEVSRLVAALSGPDGRPPTTIPPAADLADAVDLAHLADAVRAGVPAEEEAPERTVLRLVQQAWQAAVCRRVASLPGARSRHAAGGMASGPARPDGVRLAALALPQGLFAQATGAETDGLPILDPGWDGISPGNRARQRLGTAPMQHPDSEGKQVLRQAVEGCEFLQAALDVFNGLTDPVSWLMDKVGLGPSGMPGMLLSGMVQWMFDAGAAISQALGGDPPRADYKSLDVPPRPELPVLAPRKGLSAARARAGNAAAAGLRDWYASLRAAQISLDRVGGALAAGDGAWARRQALAFVYHKRQAGERMVAACERYGALLDVMEDEGVEAEGVTLAQLSTHLAALREKGFRPESLEAARRLGLSDEEIEAARRRRLSFAPDDDLDDPLVLGRQVSEDLLDLGHRWLALPEVAAPAAPAP